MLSRSKGLNKRFRPADIFLLVFLLSMSVSGIFFIKEVMPKSTNVIIEVDGKQRYSLPLGTDSVTEVKGPEGPTIVEVKNGKVRVTESECPGKICVKQGWVDRGAIVCIPNRIIVRLDAEYSDKELDAVTE